MAIRTSYLRARRSAARHVQLTCQLPTAMAQSTPPASVLRTTKLASTVATSSSVLIDRFSDILEIAAPKDKDKYITSAETYQIDVHASAMVLTLCCSKLTAGARRRGTTHRNTEVETTVDTLRGEGGECGAEQGP